MWNYLLKNNVHTNLQYETLSETLYTWQETFLTNTSCWHGKERNPSCNHRICKTRMHKNGFLTKHHEWMPSPYYALYLSTEWSEPVKMKMEGVRNGYSTFLHSTSWYLILGWNGNSSYLVLPCYDHLWKLYVLDTFLDK